MSDSGQSTENEQPPSTPELCMDIVRDYGKELLSKVVAVKSIIAAFDESSAYADISQDQIDAAIGTYISMLDQHDSTRSLAALRGEMAGVNHGQESGDEDCAPASKRPCSESPGARTSSKKRVPNESLFAWLADDEADTTVLSASQELTRKLVQNHVLDLKASKRMVLGAKRVPEFPDSEWNNVLAGKAVNLDVVFSGMYSTVTDNRAIENIGDLELHFGATKPAKTVETHGDWVVAWRIVFKATRFIFPHRETELEEYNDFITSYFASIHPTHHSKVLNLDRAIRKHVGSVNNVSLNDFNKFRYLETRHLQGHGAGESSTSSKEKTKNKDSSDQAWRKADPCRLWNDGKCSHQASSCRFRHICELCRGPHRKGLCSGEKNIDAWLASYSSLYQRVSVVSGRQCRLPFNHQC
jgi:hypothetical protein